MGNTSYNSSDRSLRAEKASFKSAFTDESKVFAQQVERKAHKDMDSKGIILRESRDSEAHPNSVPIILAMDVTGSMGDLPKFLVTEGLPKIMEKLLQRGVDPALLFMAVGDHECDKFPIQIGQFESGDAELDMWLTRTYIEKGGGGNAGESYLLPWYFASYCTKTDAWDKRAKRGYIFTIGDEPTLKNLPGSAVTTMFGSNVGQKTNYTWEELLASASERYNVFHINIEHNSLAATNKIHWTSILGQNALTASSVDQVADIIADTIAKHESASAPVTGSTQSSATHPTENGSASAKTDSIPNML